MMQAESQPNTRQDFSPIGAQHPDAELLGLGAQLDIHMKREKALIEMATDENLETTLVIAEICVRDAAPVARRIEALQARTMEGLLVRAKALKWSRGEDTFDLSDYGQTGDVRLVNSIISDLLAM